MGLGREVGHAAPCGRERFLVSMQGLNTLYGDGIVDQGAITTASELSSTVRKDRSCACDTVAYRTELGALEGVDNKRENRIIAKECRARRGGSCGEKEGGEVLEGTRQKGSPS